MSSYWTAGRIANRVHRAVFGPRRFTRRRRQCQRTDGGLRRTVTFHTETGPRPRVEMVIAVAVAGLPAPATGHRRDSLWGQVRTATGHHWYPLPPRDDTVSADLLADAAGPVLAVLLRADGLAEFVLWAQEIFLGDGRPGHCGRFQTVYPQGTGPLQAAAFAAAALGDLELVEFLTARVENEGASEHYFADFLTEIRQLQPRVRERHPIVPPVHW